MRDTYKEIIVILTAGSVLFLVLAGVVVFVLLFYQKRRFRHQQQMTELQNSIQQELLKTQLEAQENAFRQIGEELHDNVGQLLSSTKILLAITERSLPQVPDTLQTAGTTLAQAIKDLRSLSKSLNREWLEQFNLIDNLRTEADRINVAKTIHVDVHAGTRLLPLRAEAQVMLFRIIQEALQNAVRHAGAQTIDICIECRDKTIDVSIQDDGKGLPQSPHSADATTTGLGLLNMRRRAHLLGGSIEWLSAKGTKVNILLPVEINEI